MIPSARLVPGRGFRPSQAFLYYLQRIVCQPLPRNLISRTLAAAVNRLQPSPRRESLDRASSSVVEALRDLGLAHIAPLADAAQLKGMYDYFLDQPVVAAGGRRGRLEDLAPGTASAEYDLPTVVNCPGLMELVNSPYLLNVAAAYIGCKPTLSRLGVRWTFPAGERHAHYQHFHRDIDDWRFLKLFIYLTDVDEDCGPHCYVRASHRLGFSWRARNYSTDEVSNRFGPDGLEMITGPRGTTFLADTLGIHRVNEVRGGPRLMLQAQYSILPVFALAYEPVPTAEAGVDGYVNRLLVTPAGLDA